MKTISILGCGWLGMALGIELVTEGHVVKGSTTQHAKFDLMLKNGIEPFLVNFDPQLSADHANEFFACDVLVVSIPPRRKAGLADVYVEQITALANFLKEQLSTPKIIFVSSTSIYRDENKTVTEQDADPSSYMFKAEEAMLSVGRSQVTILRFGGLIGPNRNPGRFLAGKKAVPGGNNPINLIDQRDCIAIIKRIITKNAWGETFNACSDHHPSKSEFYTKASTELGLEPPQFLENDHAPFKIVSSDKLKQHLNYQFTL